MKIATAMFSSVIEIEDGDTFSLVIENQKLFRAFLVDLYSQLSGEEGDMVLSENNTPIPVNKNVDITDHFAPFDINTKNILSSVSSFMEKTALNEEHFSETAELLAQIERYVSELCFDLPFKPECKKLSAAALIKALQPSIANDYISDIEAIIDYMSLVLRFSKSKLFVFVNMRSFFDDGEMEMFVQSVRHKQFRVLLVESAERKQIAGTGRLIIDSDRCEI